MLHRFPERGIAAFGEAYRRTKLRQFGEVHKKGERKVCDFFPFSLFLTSETPAENLFGIAYIYGKRIPNQAAYYPEETEGVPSQKQTRHPFILECLRNYRREWITSRVPYRSWKSQDPWRCLHAVRPHCNGSRWRFAQSLRC